MEEKGGTPAFGGGSKSAAGGPAQTFSAIEGLLSEDLVSSMNGVFQFNLTGKNHCTGISFERNFFWNLKAVSKLVFIIYRF